MLSIPLTSITGERIGFVTLEKPEYADRILDTILEGSKITLGCEYELNKKELISLSLIPAPLIEGDN